MFASDPSCLIIDDIDEAVGHMTSIGRSLLIEPSQVLREAVLHFASKRRWTVVPYRGYAAWAHDLIAPGEREWIVLDPLLSVNDLGDKAHRVRTTRGTQGLDDADYEGLDKLKSLDGEVAVLDDAATSGMTLEYVAAQVATRGIVARRFAVCASSRIARESISRRVREAVLTEYMPGDWKVAHLRDGCAFLPYSGRRADQPGLITDSSETIELRVPAANVPGSLWSVMNLDSRINRAIEAVAPGVTTNFSAELGRLALVEDLPRLGQAVPAPVGQGQRVHAKTSLSELARR